MTIRILIADDHPIVRIGIRALVALEPDLEVIAEAADGVEVVALFEREHPDVTLLDLRMPRLGGIDALRQIIAACPSAAVIALTSYGGDADIHRALDAGACGYLLKDMLGPDLVATIRAAATGQRVLARQVLDRIAEWSPRIDLTPRELEVLQLAAKGLRDREIGGALGCGEETVKTHFKHVRTKLDVEGRTEAVAVALQRGLIYLDV